MIASIAVYLSVALVTSWLVHVAASGDPVTSRVFAVSAVLLPAALAGLRKETGTDYNSYVDSFTLIAEGGVPRFSNEVGYVWLNSSLAQLGVGAQGVFFASSLITLSFVVKAILSHRQSIPAFYSMLTFMLLFYQSSFNMVRMMIATAIFVYNIENITARRPWRFVLLSLVAMLFHMSAAVTIPLYWLLARKNIASRKSVLLASSVAFLVLAANIDEILAFVATPAGLPYYENYVGTDSGREFPFWQVFLYAPLVLPGLIAFRRYSAENRGFAVHFSLLLFAVLLPFVTFQDVKYLDRVGWYFLAASIFVVPVYLRSESRRGNAAGASALLMYLFAYWFVYYFYLNSHGTFPYLSILG